MKKLLYLLLISILSFATVTKTHAQSIGTPIQLTMYNTWGQYQPSGTPSITVDSIRTFYLYTGPIHGFKDNVTIAATATKASGTMTGTATLQVSEDGIGWSNYQASYDTTGNKAITQTWTLVNNTTPQTYRWVLPNWGDHYARIVLVTTAVAAATVTGTYGAYVRSYH